MLVGLKQKSNSGIKPSTRNPNRFVVHYIRGGAGVGREGEGCSSYNGLYVEVPWPPLERSILFCSGFRYEWLGIFPVELY